LGAAAEAGFSVAFSVAGPESASFLLALLSELELESELELSLEEPSATNRNQLEIN
jgi:hypothetical protein